MLGPSAVIMALFVIYPLIKAMWLGQQRCGVTQCTNKGFGQYVDAFRSNEFQDALVVTLKYALITVPIGLVLGVGNVVQNLHVQAAE